jgi:alpha-mannosidase
VFNPLNWPRRDIVRLATPVGPVCQALPGDGGTLCRLDLPPVGLAGAPVGEAGPPRVVPLPPVIETRHYRVRIDPATGAISSLQLKTAGRELLAGPANVVVAEQPQKRIGSPGDHMVNRAERQRVADSNRPPARLTVTTGPLATVLEAESEFVGGGRLRRQTILYHDDARIDFETELNDLPDRTVVVAEFPLAGPVREVRRGIPYGFSLAAWPEPTEAAPGFAKGIAPAVRWSHYQLDGAGVALLDQGLSGRELAGDTPLVFLYNAAEKYRGYPNAWLSGAGRHIVRYALVAHAGDFAMARVPQLAWEFNQPPLVLDAGAPARPESFVQTSDNVIVEALRREGGEIELRLAECLGRAGPATLTLNLPHRGAALTDLVGGRRQPLRGGPRYTFPIRPQQIVTLRFATAGAVAEIKPLTEWDELVPEAKRAALRRYLPEVKGHPPAGGQ